ncbi:unnamed protein product [Blepharisma stoltei]|uniref:Protein kinase domain-containing protein n=1 Tax=Blepharisma stoltei TaxID=1481888 RepID=A0AAU9KRC4_9CILI|nr:unnamed protein product [Blepharisma stoltei]
MRKLNHPNITHLHQVFESDTHIYMILDYAKGGSLYEKIIKKQTLPETSVLKFCRELLKVLKYLNSKKIVHRDIKLENILLDSQDDNLDFKLADFGLATKITGELTLRCGSPGYIAPEILRKEKYGYKVDIFGAGVIYILYLQGKCHFLGIFKKKC